MLIILSQGWHCVNFEIWSNLSFFDLLPFLPVYLCPTPAAACHLHQLDIHFWKMACVCNSSEETSSVLINRCLVHISDPLFILLPGKNHRHKVSNISFCKMKWTVKHTKWIIRKLAHIYRGFCSDLRVCDVPVKLAVCITENACYKSQNLQIGM